MNIYQKYDLLNSSLRNDKIFASQWEKMSFGEKKQFINIYNFISRMFISHDDNVKLIHRLIATKTKNYFGEIKEHIFNDNFITNDWCKILMNDSMKNKLFKEGLELMIKLQHEFNQCLHYEFYGNIKPISSIKRIMGKNSNNDDRILMNVRDLIRFRVIVNSLTELKTLALEIVKRYKTNIIMVRNFYSTPKYDDLNDPYRAIHFYYAIGINRIFEIQLLTRIKDATGRLEHPIIFKKMSQDIGIEKINFLRINLLKANIYDYMIDKNTNISLQWKRV